MGGVLSGGAQQRPRGRPHSSTELCLLILDEVTEGQAPLVRAEIGRCLHVLRAAEQNILVVDPYAQRLLGLADRRRVLERDPTVGQLCKA